LIIDFLQDWRRCAFLSVLMLLIGTASAREEGTSTLVLGRVSDDPAAHYERLKPLLDYVVERMADVGIREGRILMARDGQAMNSYLRQGRVDWVTETASGAISMMDRGGAELFLHAWRGGRAEYRTLFIARRDSPIEALEDLRGRSIGFQHPMSTSGYRVPAGLLLEAGLDLAILLSPMDRPDPDFLSYAFTGHAQNSLTWVQKGVVDSAAISDQDWEDYVLPIEDAVQSLRIFATSPPIPRGLELVRSGLDPRIRARLEEILLSADRDPAARDALSNYFRTERFTAPNEALLEQIEKLRQPFMRVRDELE
jgi:phosphonate transport system substrate-binding protein